MTTLTIETINSINNVIPTQPGLAGARQLAACGERARARDVHGSARVALTDDAKLPFS